MKLPPLTIRVGFDDVREIINDIAKLQKYKLSEDDDRNLVDIAEVVNVLQLHITAELVNPEAGVWIPVSERLPDEYKAVLCYYEYFRYGEYNCMFRTIDRGYYGNSRWGGTAGQGDKNNVLAWMPLPEPPKDV